MLFHFNEFVGGYFRFFILRTPTSIGKFAFAWVVLNKIENCILIEYPSKCYYLHIYDGYSLSPKNLTLIIF